MSGQDGGGFGAIGGGVVGYPLDNLHKEVAYIAYHFHWPYAQIMALEHQDRLAWVKEIADINRRDRKSVV